MSPAQIEVQPRSYRKVLQVPLLLLLLLTVPLVHGGAVFQAEPSQFAFGRQTVNAGSYDFRFIISNAGDRTLQITGVHPGCHCVTANLAKPFLAPGATTELTGTFNGTAYEGWVEESILLRTNDEVAPLRAVSFRIFLPYRKPGVRLLPVDGELFARLEDGQLQASVAVENCNPSGSITVSGVRLPDGWSCPTRFPLAVPAESRQTLEFVRTDDGAIRNFRGRPFAALTNAPGQATLPGTIAFFRKHTASPAVTPPPASWIPPPPPPPPVPAAPLATASPDSTTTAPREPWVKQPTVPFLPTELRPDSKQRAKLDLGTHELNKGAEAEFRCQLAAPPLTELTLILQYNPFFLEYVPDSARPLGPAFRQPLEVTAGRAPGTLAIVSTGTPGAKNINSTGGEPVLSFRMRAKQTGQTTLRPGSSCRVLGGGSSEVRMEIGGGSVTIR